MAAKGGAHVQLVVNIGSILQQGVHDLRVSVLRGDSEGGAAVLTQRHTRGNKPAV